MVGENDDSNSSPYFKNWTLQIYETNNGALPYGIFRDSLDVYTRAVLDISVEEILRRQGNNVCNSLKFGRSLRGGLYEFKISKSLSSLVKDLGISHPLTDQGKKSVLLRVFFAVEGEKVLILLAGYDKKKDDSSKRQNKEITYARKLLREHQAKNM